VQETEVDGISFIEKDLPPVEYECVSDGERWCIRSGTMFQSCEGGEVSEWDVRQRLLTLLSPGSSPHPESVMFLLTQAQEFNDVIPVGVFLSACSCAVGQGAAGHKREVTALGWKHRIECTSEREARVTEWELVIPAAADVSRAGVERHVRVEVTEWDDAGLPLKLIRVVEEWQSGAKVRTLGRSVVTVMERKAFVPVVDAARLQPPLLTDGWTVIDTTRSLQYVHGETNYTLAGFSLRAKSPIRGHPSALRLRDLLSAPLEN
jgi:hypothetical protein